MLLDAPRGLDLLLFQLARFLVVFVLRNPPCLREAAWAKIGILGASVVSAMEGS